MDNLPAIQKLALTKFERTDLPSYLTPDEIQAMLETCKDNRRNHAFLNILWQTGARVSEALKVTRNDIDSYGLTIKILTEKQRNKRSKPVFRIIPISPELSNELASYILHYNITDRLFAFSRQRAWQIIRQTAERAGLSSKNIHPHVFRHSFAIHCLRSGMPLPVLQKVLGHSSILVTMIYLRVVQPDIQEFMRKVQF